MKPHFLPNEPIRAGAESAGVADYFSACIADSRRQPDVAALIEIEPSKTSRAKSLRFPAERQTNKTIR